MASRSLNKVLLIGNLTRDPELRYTSKGTAVCNFGVATNRYWVTEAGEKREETEFHRIVSWNKLAELCGQLLAKGRKVYVEGRLQSRTWTGADGTQRTTTEVVISDMVILDSKRAFEAARMAAAGAEKEIDVTAEGVPPGEKAEEKAEKEKTAVEKAGGEEEVGVSPKKKASKRKKRSSQEEQEEEKVSPDEIPF